MDVCRALDGLPLAIELAAARTRSLALADIARRLDDRFAILSDPTGRRPRRQAALAAAIGWSYDLLFPDDQRCLWALACFGDGAPLDAAQAVAAVLGVPAAASLDSFDRLVDRSLARADLDTGGVRYRLLDSIRSFAAARLDEAGCGDDARRAHASWVADLAERIGEVIGGRGQPWAVATTRAERANIDLALAWTAHHQPALGVGIVRGCGPAWIVLGDGAAGAARIRAALVAAPDAAPGEAVPAWLLACWLEASAGDVELAASDLGHADDLAASLEDPTIGADVARHHAFLAIQQGRPDEALDHALASLAVAERAGLERQIAGASNLVAFAWMARGEHDLARRAATAALERRVALGDTWGQMHAEAMLGRIAGAAGDLAEADARLRGAAARSVELGFAGQSALHLTSLGALQQQHGHHDDAIAHARAGPRRRRRGRRPAHRRDGPTAPRREPPRRWTGPTPRPPRCATTSSSTDGPAAATATRPSVELLARITARALTTTRPGGRADRTAQRPSGRLLADRHLVDVDDVRPIERGAQRPLDGIERGLVGAHRHREVGHRRRSELPAVRRCLGERRAEAGDQVVERRSGLRRQVQHAGEAGGVAQRQREPLDAGHGPAGALDGRRRTTGPGTRATAA